MSKPDGAAFLDAVVEHEEGLNFDVSTAVNESVACVDPSEQVHKWQSVGIHCHSEWISTQGYVALMRSGLCMHSDCEKSIFLKRLLNIFI